MAHHTKLKKYPKPDKVTWLFIIMLVVLVGSMSFASAELTTFDNVKSYDVNTKTVNVKNLFGLGKTYADIKLNTPINNKVGLGYQKVAEFTINNYEDYNDVIKGLELFDIKKDMEKIDRDINYKVLSYKDIQINETTGCGLENNKTCIQKTNSYIIKTEVWTDLEGKDFKRGNNLTIGIFTDVQKGDYVEWIPNFYGVKINEWASWTASLDTDLEFRYAFNESSGDAIDYSTNGWDFTPTGVDYEQGVGMVDQSYLFNTDNPVLDEAGARALSGTGSWAAWVYPVTISSTQFIMSKSYDSAGRQQYGLKYDSGKFSCASTAGSTQVYCAGTTTVNTGQWSHGGCVLNTTGLSVYYNGTLENYCVQAGAGGSGGYNFTFGQRGLPSSQPYTIDTKIDEIYFWSRDLSASEMSDVFNYDGLSSFNLITLNAPANDVTVYQPTMDFNCTAAAFAGVKNVSLVINNSIVDTNSSGYNNTLVNFNYDLGSAGFYNWSCWSYDNDDVLNNTGIEVRNITYANDLAISLNAPVEALNSSLSSIDFSATPSDETAVVNASLYIDSVLNQTNSSGYNNTLITFTTSLGEGDHDWYFETCDAYACINTEIRNLTVNTIAPIVNNAENITDLVVFSLPVNSTWNYTATDTNIDSCYWNSTEDPTYNIETCNASITNAEWTTGGNKTLQYCANDTFGWETCNEAWVYVYYVNYTQTEDLDPVGEGTNVTFDLNVSLNSIATTIANLKLNDSFYDYDSRSCTTDYCYFKKSVVVPDGYGNTTGFPQLWNWNFTIDGITTNTTTADTNVTVYELAVDDCSSYGDVILNITMNDEEANTQVNGTLGSNIELDLLLTSTTNSSFTLTYNNTWVNDTNVAVCIPSNILNNSEYYIDFDIGFDSTDRVWEFFFLDDGVLNSTKVFDDQTDYTIDLMDLLTTDSTSFLFNYFDQDGLTVDDIIVHTFRKYIGEGLFREIERSQADENGDTIVHLVEEDVIYYFLITQYGVPLYTSSTYTALCQATPCSIQLEAGGESAEFTTDYDLVEGGSYTLTSDVSSRTVTLDYLLDTAQEVNVTVYKYDYDGDISAVTSNASTGLSDELVLTVPLSAGNVSFFTAVYKEGEFINSEWVDFEGDAQDTFGTVLALFLAILIILTFGLIAVSEGAGTIVFVILGVAVAGFLGLITTALSTGVSVILYLIIAGGILIWKLTGGRR